MEHLLRDVKDSSVGSLAGEVSRMTIGLRGLKARLAEVQDYLCLVVSGTLPVNHDIIYELQARHLCSHSAFRESASQIAPHEHINRSHAGGLVFNLAPRIALLFIAPAQRRPTER